MLLPEIIHVLMLKESATQKPTKFQAPKMSVTVFNPSLPSIHTPLTAFRLDWCKIVVVQHELGGGEAWLALHLESSRIVGDLGPPGCCHHYE